MPLYDFLAPFYDPFLRPFYRPYRIRALEFVTRDLTGATVLDLACGTGQNFPLLAPRLGPRGRIIGVDLSSGMLRRAARALSAGDAPAISLIHHDARKLSPEVLHARAPVTAVDLVLCTYGFTAMPGWEAAFHASWQLLQPGGAYLIHDIHAAVPTFHSRAVEFVTRCDFSPPTWAPLQLLCSNFRFASIDPSTHLFGGRLFVACGTKPR